MWWLPLKSRNADAIANQKLRQSDMAEISLILTSPGGRSPGTAIAIADRGVGVASITQRSIKELARVRDHIVAMMGGAPRMTSSQLRSFGKTMGKILFCDDVG